MGNRSNNKQPKNSRALTRGRTRKLRAVGDGANSPPVKKQRMAPVPQTTKKDDIADLNHQAMTLFQQGHFDAAFRIFQRAISVSTTERRRANNTNAAAEEASALLLSEILPTGGAGSSLTASSYIYQRTDFDEGLLTVYSDPLPVTQAASEGPQDESALQAILLFNAGQARMKLNDLDGAAKIFDQALQIFMPSVPPAAVPAGGALSALSTDQPVIIPLLHAVGKLAYRNGKLPEALMVYEVALKHCHKIHGKQHVSAARTLNCIGVICYHHGSPTSPQRPQLCLEEALQIMAEQERDNSSLSLETATIRNNLGRVHVQQEAFDTALVLYEQALETRKQHLGTDHIDHAATAFNAGQCLHQLGELDRALALYEHFLQVAQSKFTRNHRDVAVVLSGMAQIYQDQRNYDKALALYEESLVVGRAALGNAHSEVAMLLNRLGNHHFDRGNFDKALIAYEEGLAIEQQVLEDQHHPNIIVTLTNIGEIYRKKNDWPKAIGLYLQALQLQKQCYGPSSLEAAATLHVLGMLYDASPTPCTAGLALSCWQEALVIRRSILGDCHLDVATTLTHLATMFFQQGGTCMALQLFTESLRIRIQVHGTHNHSEVAFSLYNVGLCHFHMGSHKEAIQCFQETLRIERDVLVDDDCPHNRDIALTLFKLGEAHNAVQNPADALECFQEALEMEQEVEDETDATTVARILKEIGNIHLAAGDTRQMMQAFVEAGRVLQGAGLFQCEHLHLADIQLYAFAASCPSSASAA